MTGEERKVSNEGFSTVLRRGALVSGIEVLVEIRCRNRSRRTDPIPSLVPRRCDFRRLRHFGGCRRHRCPVQTHAVRKDSILRFGGNQVIRIVHRFADGLVGGFLDAFGFEDRLDLFRRQFLAAFRGLFEHGVLGDLRDDHVLQLKPVELKHRHHLDEPGVRICFCATRSCSLGESELIWLHNTTRHASENTEDSANSY